MTMRLEMEIKRKGVSSVERRDTCLGSVPLEMEEEMVEHVGSVSRRATSPRIANSPTLASSAKRRGTWPRTVNSPTLAGNARKKATRREIANSLTCVATVGKRDI